MLLESTKSVGAPVFRRFLQQLFQQSQADQIRGIIFGRMPSNSEVTGEVLVDLVARFVPKDLPVLADACFGHTYPVGSFPIGREVIVQASMAKSLVRVC